MPYRSEHFSKIANGRSVLEIALDVHMRNTGSFEEFDPDGMKYYADKGLLQEVVAQWKPGTAKWCGFDNCVLNLIKEVLKEPHWSSRFSSKPSETAEFKIPERIYHD